MGAVLCFTSFDRSLHCVDGCCFVIYLFWQVWLTVLVSVPPPPKKKKKKKIFIWSLCQNSLTREQKIRVVGFVLKVVIITDLGQRQKSAQNAENTTDHPETSQVPSLYCFSLFRTPKCRAC